MANYKKWSNAEREFIRSNSNVMSDRELSLKMSQISGENISSAMIRQQRRKLKAVKSKGRPKKINQVVEENG